MCDKDRTLITRYELVEVVVDANAAVGQLNLPNNVATLTNNPERKIFIKDIEVFPDYAQTGSIKNNGTPGFPVGEVPKVSIALYYNEGVFIRYIPLAKLIYTVPPGNIDCPYQHERVAFDNLYPFDLGQSFLQFNTAPAGMPYVIPIGFTYTFAPALKR